ncbi:MAG: hypothetical protein R3C03_03310 [Pirellulaceae bacterium]
MADWVDALGEAFFRVTELFIDTERPRRSAGIVFAMLTAFGILGTLVAVYLGPKLDPVGYYILIPMLLASAAIAVYCFVTDGPD